MKRFSQFIPHFILLMTSLLVLASCTEERDEDVKDIRLDLEVSRIDSLMFEFVQAIHSSDSLTIWGAFEQYVQPEADFFATYLFLPPHLQQPSRERDSVITTMLGQALKDSALFQLLDTVRNVFPYNTSLADQISAPLKRLKLLFPDVQLPRFTAHVNGYPVQGDWNQVDQVASFPGVISFGLHYFMGEDWPLYPAGIYGYQRRRLNPNLMDVALVNTIAEEFVTPIPPTAQVSLLDFVVRAGIKQTFLHQLLPYTPDSVLLSYTASQMEWADLFESANYKLLKPNLFETDQKFERDYISDKAFTSELAQESAPRLGEYIGWKMVTAYLDRHPEVSLAELVEMTDYEMIMRESRYKP